MHDAATEIGVGRTLTRSQIRPSAGPNWVTWSLFLLSVYVVISAVGWRRTLIDTEIWTVFHAARSFDQMMEAVRGDLVHPPLSYLIEWLWIRAFGATDSAVKALAFLINVPTFLVFTWLFSRVTRHWRLGSLLFFGFYFRIGSAPNQTRMYGLGLLLTVMAMALWERWCESQGTRLLIAWFVTALLLVYTHLFGPLMVLGFVVANWLVGPRRWAFTAVAAAVALSFLPWLLFVLPVYESRGLADNLTWVPRQIHVALGILSYGLLGEFDAPLSRRVLFAAVAGAINLVLLLLLLRSAISLWPPGKTADTGARWFWGATVLVAVPILSHLVFAVFERPALHWRFVLGILPAYWLLLSLVTERNGRPGRLLLYGVVVPWVIATSMVAFTIRSRPSPARQAAAVIVSEQRAGDLILAENLSLGNGLYWEMKHRLGRDGRMLALRPPAAVARLSVLPPADLHHLDLAGVDRVWFFFSDRTTAERARESMATDGFDSRRIFPAKDPFLLLFVRKSL